MDPSAPLPTEPNAIASSSTAPAGPSKTALKKLAKLARFAAEKPSRRLAERERRKAKSEQQRADLKAGVLTEEELAEIEERRKIKEFKRKAKNRGGNVTDDEACWKGGVVIDLGFDELMNVQEIKSITSQLSFLYSTNRLSPRPFQHVLSTSFTGRTRTRMDTVGGQGGGIGWERWVRMGWWESGLEGLLPAPGEEVTEEERKEREIRLAGDAKSNKAGNPFEGQELIYLSADSEYELEELSENQTYIIGGIVDRNRYKNLCQNKATTLNIRTARLPIGKYLTDLATRKVLTVNQVFDILLRFIEGGAQRSGEGEGDGAEEAKIEVEEVEGTEAEKEERRKADIERRWRGAFEKVVPSRKFKDGGKKDHSGEYEVEDEEEEGMGWEGEEGEMEEKEGQEVKVEMTEEEMEALMNEM